MNRFSTTAAFHPRLALTYHSGSRLLALFGTMASWIMNGFLNRLTISAVMQEIFKSLLVLFTGATQHFI